MKKKIVLMLGGFFLMSCTKDVEKPDKLLTEQQMVEILYDISLLEALRTNSSHLLEQNQISAKTFILDKYKVDSLTFAQNNAYFGGDYKKYKSIMDAVQQKFSQEVEQLEVEIKNHLPKEIETTTTTRREIDTTINKRGVLSLRK